MVPPAQRRISVGCRTSPGTTGTAREVPVAALCCADDADTRAGRRSVATPVHGPTDSRTAGAGFIAGGRRTCAGFAATDRVVETVLRGFPTYLAASPERNQFTRFTVEFHAVRT